MSVFGVILVRIFPRSEWIRKDTYVSAHIISACVKSMKANRLLYFDLTHFQPMFHFYTPWKHQKTYGFLMSSGGIEVDIGWKRVKLKSDCNKYVNTRYIFQPCLVYYFFVFYRFNFNLKQKETLETTINGRKCLYVKSVLLLLWFAENYGRSSPCNKKISCRRLRWVFQIWWYGGLKQKDLVISRLKIAPLKKVLPRF